MDLMSVKYVSDNLPGERDMGATKHVPCPPDSSNRGPGPLTGEHTVFSTSGAGALGIHMQKNEARPLPHLTKLNSRWI